MYILETEESFDAAHFLKGHKGKCRNIHGHKWRVLARIQACSLKNDPASRDMVLDFSDFREQLRRLTDQLDHTLIIEEGALRPETLTALQEEGFPVNCLPYRPTAERFSEYFFWKLRESGCPVSSVTVYETPTNCVTYQED